MPIWTFLFLSTWDIKINELQISISQAACFLFIFSNIGTLLKPGIIRVISYNALFLLCLLSTTLFVAQSLEQTLAALGFSASIFLYLTAGATLLSLLRSMPAKRAESHLIATVAIYAAIAATELIHDSFRGNFFLPGLAENIPARAFFSDDANWTAILVGFINIYVAATSRSKIARLCLSLTLFICFFTASRVGFILWGFSLLIFLHRKNSSFRALLFFGGCLSVIIITAFGTEILNTLPDDYSYDLTSLERNPRLNDAIYIYEAMLEYGDLAFGSGFGPISKYTGSMSWRESYPVSNQLWLQVFANFGFLGIALFIVASLFFVLASKGLVARSFIIAILFALQFHNFSQKPLFGPVFFLALHFIQCQNKKNSIRRAGDTPFLVPPPQNCTIVSAKPRP